MGEEIEIPLLTAREPVDPFSGELMTVFFYLNDSLQPAHIRRDPITGAYSFVVNAQIPGSSIIVWGYILSEGVGNGTAEVACVVKF